MLQSSQTIYQKALDICIERVRKNSTIFGGEFPHIGDGNEYVLGTNDHWMTSLWTGQLWLAFSVQDDVYFRDVAMTHLNSFQNRLNQDIDINHDLGFLFSLSACAQYETTGDSQARDIALTAAKQLTKRFNSQGEYIQAWKEFGNPEEGGRFIIDCMLNIPLLYWATAQSGDPSYANIATRHAKTTQRYIIRPDGSTAHSFIMNPDTGEPIGQKTVQGYADDSVWSRGQAWAIYGFSVAYEWCNDPDFLATSRKAADLFLSEITSDYIPLWDLRVPTYAPQARDTSAAVIAAVGMMRLAHLLDDESKNYYQQAAQRLIDAQISFAFDWAEDGVQGLLRHSTYDIKIPKLTEQYTLFGDYFFMEALVWLAGYDIDFFGKVGSKETDVS